MGRYQATHQSWHCSVVIPKSSFTSEQSSKVLSHMYSNLPSLTLTTTLGSGQGLRAAVYSQNSYVEVLSLSAMVFGGWTFGR